MFVDYLVEHLGRLGYAVTITAIIGIVVVGVIYWMGGEKTKTNNRKGVRNSEIVI